MEKKQRNHEIVDLSNKGMSYSEIGEKYGMTRQRIYELVRKAKKLGGTLTPRAVREEIRKGLVVPINRLPLSGRAVNALSDNKISNTDELALLDPDWLWAMEGVGPVTASEIAEVGLASGIWPTASVETARITKAKDDGRVEALISWNYNNLKCSRPLPPDATDEDYRREFEKAIQLTEEAVRNLEKLKEEQRHFYDLCDEWRYLYKMDERIAKRVTDGDEPRTEVEMALHARLKRMHQFCFEEHTSAWEWEHRLYDELAEKCDDGDEPPF